VSDFEDLLRQIEQGVADPTARTLTQLARGLDARLVLAA